MGEYVQECAICGGYVAEDEVIAIDHDSATVAHDSHPAKVVEEERERFVREKSREATLAAARKRGYAADADAFEAGYTASRRRDVTEADRAFILYPGPERAAFTAGWIQQQQDRTDERAARAAAVPAPSNSTTVWTPATGWMDNGPRAATTLDDRGRLRHQGDDLDFVSAMLADGHGLETIVGDAQLAIEWALNLEGGDYAKALDRIREDPSITSEAKGIADEVLGR